MTKQGRNIVLFFGLLLIQLLVVDNIRLGNYIHPCIYVLFVMMLPLDMPRVRVLFLGFLMGFSIDLFEGTLGLHAAATTLMAFLRPGVINLVTGVRKVETFSTPYIYEVGIPWFLRYSIVLMIIHNTALFFLETFNFRLVGETFLRIVISVVVSEMVIMLSVLLFSRERKK